MDSIRDLLPRTAELIAADFAAGQHKGFQLYVSLRGDVVVDAASGEASPGVPMTPETLLPWLSAGKPLTAMGIALLWQRGKLSLDDAVADLIPEFGQNGKETITIRHLLTHTAGVVNIEVGYPQATWEQSLATICAAPLEADWIVGRSAGYQPHVTWFVLGEIIRRLDGRPCDAFVREEICEPLGMLHSWMAVPPEVAGELGERIGHSWRRAGRGLERDDWHEPPRLTRPSPGGSFRGPVRELGRFYESLLASLKGESDPFWPQTVEAMTTPHRIGEMDRTFRQVVDWCLGFQANSNRYGADTIPYGFGRHSSPRAFGHGGSQKAIGFADPDHGLVVAWAANAQIGEPRHNTRNRAINTAIYEDLGLADVSI